jgi:hypothetical protein
VRRSLDLVAKLPLVQPLMNADGELASEMVAIIHIEVESADRVKHLRKAMFQSFGYLRQKYPEPILPVALYLRVAGEGIGVDHYREHFGDFEVLRYNYLYAGLPALDAEQYLVQDNWLGVALSALMRVPADRRARFKAEALRRVLASPENEFRKFLLAECVQTYLSLDRNEQQELDGLLEGNEYQEVQTMATTWYEKGMEQGIEQGERRFAAALLEKRFGPLSADFQQRLATWPESQLTDLVEKAYQVDSLEQLPLAEGHRDQT